MRLDYVVKQESKQKELFELQQVILSILSNVLAEVTVKTYRVEGRLFSVRQKH